MFVRAANPVWYFVDLIGIGLNDEYYAFFLTNTLPYLPQAVYRDPQGLTAWPNPLEFFPNGTLPDNLYFDPNLVYRIEIRHGNSQTDPLIYEINNFVPGSGITPSDNSLAILGNENQVSNGQFSQINFSSPHTITVAGTYSIAPGWDLILTGAGITTLTQLILSGSQNQINNPPFALRIDSNGWTEVSLRQRLLNNGAIWANGAITMSLTGRAQTVAETISLVYSPNAPGTPEVVATGSLGTGSYQVIQGAIDLPASTNTALSNVAFVDIIVQLPQTGIVDISNIQVIGQSDPLPVNFDPTTQIPSYQQEPEERTIDHLFHVYKNELLIKPKRSLLVGWNFPLNPFQFKTTTITTLVAQTDYIADQTILHQEAASQLQSGQNTVAERQNLVVKAVTAAATTRIALIQYIDPASIRPYWSYLMSSLVRARLTNANSAPIGIKARLIYRSSLPSTISATEPIASWASTDPVFSAGWTALSPLNDPTYILSNAYDTVEGNNSYPGYSFNSFQLPNADNANMTLGIVIYTTANLDSVAASENSVEWDKISLVPSRYAADAFPQTFDESLRECQFYYEKSYFQSTLPGSVTEIGMRYGGNPFATDGVSTVMYQNTFELLFQQIKRAAPLRTFYSPDGTISTVRLSARAGNGTLPAPSSGANPTNVPIAQFSAIGLSLDSVIMRPNTVASVMTFSSSEDSKQGEINYQYVLDARMGV